MSRLADELLALSRSREVAETAEVNRVIAWRFRFLSLLGDAIIIVGALIFTFWLRFRTDFSGIGTFSQSMTMRDNAPYVAIGGLALLLLLAHYGMYQAAQLLRYRQVSFLIIRGCAFWFVGVLFVSRVLNPARALPMSYLGLASACLLVALLTWRGVLHRISTLDAFSKHLRERILFVGWNEMSERLTKFVMSDPSHAYTVVGCIPPGSGHYEKDPPADIPHVAAFRDIIP